VKPISIAAIVVVPFVLFIAAGLIYQSQTGTDIVTGEKTGLAASEVGAEQFEKIYKNEPEQFEKISKNEVQLEQDFDSHRCIGEAKCVSELITEIIDGDIIHTENYKIRLSLVDTPEINEPGYSEATAFTAQMCPVGSYITIDQDDLQLYDQHDRLLANVFCDGKSLNTALLYNGHAEISTRYCSISEFSNYPWAQKFGCAIPELIPEPNP
jgi:endonuclease YncB( thermonuclease family)